MRHALILSVAYSAVVMFGAPSRDVEHRTIKDVMTEMMKSEHRSGLGIIGSMGIDRRQFLAQGTAALLHQAAQTKSHSHSRPEVGEFRVPLPIPPVLDPVRADATTDYYELVQREAWAEIIPGARTRIFGYNGSFPGPTIKARRGRATVVTLTNSLNESGVVHLHGGVTRPEFDGFPTDAIAPGNSRRYEYANTGRAATLWYHDHHHLRAGRNLYMGLAGFYLLEDGAEINGRLPRDKYDIPLMLQDREFTPDGELMYGHHGHRGAKGRVMLVNGAPWPALDVARRKYRFRILNGSNATPFRLALSTGQPMTQIATDGGLLPKPVSLMTIDITMGERVEVVVDFSHCPVGSRVVLQNLRARGPLSRVMRFDVVRSERDDSSVPEVLADFEPLQIWDATRMRTFVFGGKPRWDIPPAVQWVINGKRFDPSRVDADPKLGDVEVWRFVNRSFLGFFTMLHPVHTHLAPFQILLRNGRAPLPHEGGWKDTVAIDRGEKVDVIMRWSGYRGRYLLHCHNLEHEDHSMMARVEVT
jgi:FtsP/CotA-like multicopper oxidase with cupredoxin domain